MKTIAQMECLGGGKVLAGSLKRGSTDQEDDTDEMLWGVVKCSQARSREGPQIKAISQMKCLGGR